ncbi:MAG TPA: hypothetical protein DHW22_09085 [Planctomycetaceae bacterium]|nr:hypothetical protein [Planctomycetaceae bacterium]
MPNSLLRSEPIMAMLPLMAAAWPRRSSNVASAPLTIISELSGIPLNEEAISKAIQIAIGQ